ncbi:unnamed protein product [Choristocarpus tenellus]
MIFGGVSEIGGLERCTNLKSLTCECGAAYISYCTEYLVDTYRKKNKLGLGITIAGKSNCYLPILVGSPHFSDQVLSTYVNKLVQHHLASDRVLWRPHLLPS